MRYSLFILALCVAAAGCRGTDSSIELLESELRWMEDQLYLLDQELASTHAKLHSSQRYNQSLKNELSSVRKGSSGSGSGQQDDAAQQAPQFENDMVEDSDLSIPDIDLGPGADDGMNGNGSANGNGSTGNGNGAPLIDDSAIPPELDSTGLPDSTQHRSHSGQVDRIVLNSRLTGGYDFDGHPGDEGLLLVIEPQDKTGKYMAIPGDLTIAVHDASKVGDEGRIAQWDYSVEESTELLRQTLLGKGFHLQLPWPNQTPDQSELTVYTTYRSEEGRRLKTSRTIKIDVGNQSIAAADKPFSHETTLVPSPHGTGASRVTGIPSPPKAPALLPVGPNHPTAGPNWQPSRSSAVARQRQSGRSTASAPAWRPYR